MEKRKITPTPMLDNYLQLIYLKAKIRWSEWMDRMTSRLNPRTMKILFAGIISFFGSLCLLLILSGGQLSYTNTQIRPDIIQTIRAPSIPIDKTSPDTLVIAQIKAFHHYMDTLAMSEGGRKIRDSILEARPGLLDTIRVVEFMYNQKR